MAVDLPGLPQLEEYSIEMPTMGHLFSVLDEMVEYLMGQLCSVHSFIPVACAECEDSLPFSRASPTPLFYVLIPATLLHQSFFHPLSPHLAIYFLVYPSILLFPNSYIIPFWEFYFLPLSVHAQTNIIYLTLLSQL